MATLPALPPFIQSIVVSKLAYPLYDHQVNPSKIYYSLTSFPVWDSTSTPKHAPAAISQDATFNVELTPTEIATLGTLKPPFSIVAKLDKLQIFQASSDTDPATLITQLSKVSITPPVVGNQPKALPWAFVGDLAWTLTGKGPTGSDVTNTCSTHVEIYVLPKLPVYFDAMGTPLALLRDPYYLPIWMAQADQAQPILDWPTFAVQTLFNDDRMEYQLWNGTCKYTSWTQFRLPELFADELGLQCWLDLWLSDMKGVISGDARRPVNCHDIAALCQVLISLGVDYTAADVRMKYMEPFGYINKTQILGRKEDPPNTGNPNSLCNNPLYGDVFFVKQMLCDVDEVKRSALRNHLFLTMVKDSKEVVLDACLGPHTGTEDEKTYLTAVLDSRDSRYQQPENPVGFKLGATDDVANGKGIVSFVYSPCFDTGAGPNSTVINQLATAMSSEGTWSGPVVSAPPGDWNLTATWTLKPTNDTNELITVNIFRYTYFWQVVSTWNLRTSCIPRWIVGGASLTDGQADTGDGSIRMFYDSSRYYLVTIEARVGNAQSTYDIRNTIQEILDGALPMLAKPTKYINSIAVSNQLPANIGDTIKVIVKPTDIALKNYRGFNVRVSGAYALFNNYTSSADSIEFDFLARATGDGTAVITIYGGNLEWEERYIRLWVAGTPTVNGA